MIDESCLYCNREGDCTKGLPGTPCEVVGCVAHSPVGYLSWSDMTEKEKATGEIDKNGNEIEK